MQTYLGSLKTFILMIHVECYVYRFSQGTYKGT